MSHQNLLLRLEARLQHIPTYVNHYVNLGHQWLRQIHRKHQDIMKRITRTLDLGTWNLFRFFHHSTWHKRLRWPPKKLQHHVFKQSIYPEKLKPSGDWRWYCWYKSATSCTYAKPYWTTSVRWYGTILQNSRIKSSGTWMANNCYKSDEFYHTHLLVWSFSTSPSVPFVPSISWFIIFKAERAFNIFTWQAKPFLVVVVVDDLVVFLLAEKMVFQICVGGCRYIVWQGTH